jgi:hypothetical protein
MSYTLAVWEGARPKTNPAAVKTFEALIAKYQAIEKSPRPRPAIRRYVEALLAKHPDLDDDNEVECPWSDSPLINNATGPIVYFAMVFSKAKTASAFAAKLAKTHGLVCFDPQSNKLR